MKSLFIVFFILLFSCSEKNQKSSKSIHSYVDNVIGGNPLRIEITKNEKPSINIESDSLYKSNEGNTKLFGAVYADLFNDKGKKQSAVFSDSAIIYSKSDSMKALGNVVVESVKGFKLHAHEIILYNDIKLVKADDNIMFTSKEGDTLYGKGFWSNFDMSSTKILKPIGFIGDFQ